MGMWMKEVVRVGGLGKVGMMFVEVWMRCVGLCKCGCVRRREVGGLDVRVVMGEVGMSGDYGSGYMDFYVLYSSLKNGLYYLGLGFVFYIKMYIMVVVIWIFMYCSFKKWVVLFRVRVCILYLNACKKKVTAPGLEPGFGEVYVECESLL